jgi:hypothetical protein
MNTLAFYVMELITVIKRLFIPAFTLKYQTWMEAYDTYMGTRFWYRANIKL